MRVFLANQAGEAGFRDGGRSENMEGLKMRQFQNELMESSFLPNMNKKLSEFLPCVVRAEILTIFILGETINSF